jgi:hypothetical protein
LDVLLKLPLTYPPAATETPLDQGKKMGKERNSATVVTTLGVCERLPLQGQSVPQAMSMLIETLATPLLSDSFSAHHKRLCHSEGTSTITSTTATDLISSVHNFK